MYGVILIDGNSKRRTLRGAWFKFNDAEYEALKHGCNYIITLTKDGITTIIKNTEEK